MARKFKVLTSYVWRSIIGIRRRIILWFYHLKLPFHYLKLSLHHLDRELLIFAAAASESRDVAKQVISSDVGRGFNVQALY